MGTPQFRRDIQSAVEPDSVSEAIAFTLRWYAVKSAAMAIDWSTRVKTRFRNSDSSVTSCDFSASMQMRFIAAIVSTGYWPEADSAESITASVPSRTAFATSETSARVGTGLEIIDSIRRVAHLDREVAARHHDAVARVHDVLERRDRLRALDLRDQHRVPARRAQQLARHVHVRAALRERHRDEVHLHLRGGADVVD